MKIKLRSFSLLICLFFTVTANSQTFNLVWSDEFSGTSAPDPAKWGYELGSIRNNELQFYTNSTNNVRQNAGNLEISVLKEAMNGYNYASFVHTSSGHDSPTIDVTQWHVYSIEWTPVAIKWFVDGVKHHELNISNGINNTQAFHKPHYVLINLAIGGSWPGAPDAATVLPAILYCDYIKVCEYAPDVPVSVSAISVSPSTLTLPLTKTIELV